MVITRELVTHFDEYDNLHGIRSRRSGSHVFIDIFLECDPERKVGEVETFLTPCAPAWKAKYPTAGWWWACRARGWCDHACGQATGCR